MKKSKPVNRLIQDFETSEYANNDRKNVGLRRAENTLYASGFGLIMLGAWQLFEVLFRLVLDFENTKTRFMSFYGLFSGPESEGVSEGFIVGMVVSAVVVWALLSLIFQCMVGVMAMQEAKRKKKRWFYLLMTFFLIYSAAIVFYEDARQMPQMFKSFDFFQIFCQEINDVLLVITAFIVMFCGIAVKLYRLGINGFKKTGKEGV
jgi:hypothetical protein